MSALATATSALFVPADQPERYAKALASGADVVIVDLEDAVAFNAKEGARRTLVDYVRDTFAHSPEMLARLAIRLNPAREGAQDDAAALNTLPPGVLPALAGLFVPKVESAADVAAAADQVGSDIPLVAMIETALGAEQLPSITRAQGVVRLAFGALDFAADVGASHSTVLDHVRVQVVLASAAARIVPPLESPHPEFRDLQAVEDSARLARELGFTGQLCIHPAQVPVINVAFAPNPDEIAWAQKVLTVDADGGVVQVDGAMVDRPVVLRAQSIIARASRTVPS